MRQKTFSESETKAKLNIGKTADNENFPRIKSRSSEHRKGVALCHFHFKSSILFHLVSSKSGDRI